jgi:hypothetical protein
LQGRGDRVTEEVGDARADEPEADGVDDPEAQLLEVLEEGRLTEGLGATRPGSAGGPREGASPGSRAWRGPASVRAASVRSGPGRLVVLERVLEVAPKSREVFLNSRMPWPSPLPSSGSFLAPNSKRARSRTMMISVGPRFIDRSSFFPVYPHRRGTKSRTHGSDLRSLGLSRS